MFTCVCIAIVDELLSVIKGSTTTMSFHLNMKNWTYEAAERFFCIICDSHHIEALRFMETYPEFFEQLVLSHWSSIRAKHVDFDSEFYRSTSNFWRALGDETEKNYSILKFTAWTRDLDGVMVRYYCLLNRIGRHSLINDHSFHLRLLPLVLARANTTYSRTFIVYLKGLNRADGLFYIVKHGLVPMISGSLR